MKRPITNVELTFSCPEKWTNMVDVGDNKYCGKCKHLVVDFTKLTQEELENAARNAPGRLCGKFKSSQMSAQFLKYAAASAMAASILAPTSCAPEDPLPANIQAQQPTEQMVIETDFELLGEVLTVHEADTVAVEEAFDENL